MKKSKVTVCIFFILAFLVVPIYALASNSAMPEVLDEFFGDKVGMGWGGTGVGVWYPNLDGLNSALGVEIDVPIPIICGLGEGGVVPGFSVGGFGGGNIVTKGNAQLETGFGGFVFNRTFPLKEGHWYYGGLLGGGQAALVVYHNNDPSDVEQAVAVPQQSYLRTSFFAIGPQVGVQIPITPFIQLRASAGYLLAIGSDWELVGEGELPGGEVNWSGPLAQVAIVFGGSGRVHLPDPSGEASVDL